MNKILTDGGWIASRLERCLYYFRDKDTGRLLGAAISHVDDLLLAGDGSDQWMREINRLQELLKLTLKDGSFRFCGKDIVQNPDGSITINQTPAVLALEKISLPKGARADQEAFIPADQVSQLRSGIGGPG